MRHRLLLVLAAAAIPLVAMTADAQRGRRHPAHHHAAPKKKAPASAHIHVGRDGGAASTVRANPDAGVLMAKTLDGGTRVFRFGELDVEGRLRSPQIVYFLRRVRAEFAAGDLGHRSFMGELSETRKSSAF
jgi:hypothetical protein